MTGHVVLGVMRAEKLQRLADAEPDFRPDNRPVDFPAHWSLYAYMRGSGFDAALRHQAHVRQAEQRVAGGSHDRGDAAAEKTLQRILYRAQVRGTQPCAA
jgi:hypothetical protein